MSKGASYTHLMSKKMRRTILRSPLQFLTMTLILALASTLFSGLYASHLTFKDQVSRAYSEGNIADIFTTLNYNYDDFTVDDPNKDLQLIKDTVGDAGTVENQYYASGKIHGLDANISISDTYPTINRPTEILHEKSPSKDEYLYISDLYLTVGMNYGKRETWIDDNDNFVPIEIKLGITNLRSRIKEEKPTLNAKLNECLTDGGVNILDDTFLNLTVTPTGSMKHPENIASNNTQPYTFIANRKFIAKYLNEVINSNYDIAKLETDSSPEAKECLTILGDGDASKSEIMTKYWCNNRCVTRLNNRNDANIYQDKIDKAFSKKTSASKNNIMFNSILADTTVDQQLSTDMLQSVQLCYVFPPLFLLVAVLIVLTTISQIILKERKEIGTLKAIGASNRSILTYYMGLTGIVSLIGIAIGLVVGPLLLPIVLNLKYRMLYNLPDIRFVFPTTFAIIMTVSILLITMLVAFLITRKEAKALPVTSMRPKPVNIKKKDLSSKEDDNTHKLCFKMAKRNIFCSKTRSIMVILGVLGCTALLCCGFGVDDSIQKGVDNDKHMFYNTDTLIYFTNQTEETFEKIRNLKTDDPVDPKPMITDFEPYGYLPVSASQVGVIDKSFSTYVYSINPYLEPENKFFNLGYEPRNNMIAVSSKVAKELNVHEGDYLTFNFLGKNYPAGKIGKVIDIFFMHGIFIDGSYPMFPMTEHYPTCAYARFNKEVDQKTVLEALRAVPGVSSALDRDDLTDLITKVTSSIGYITMTIKIFAILLAVVAIYNLALLNFKENIRNIATMKVLGFNRREVAESLFFEIITLSTVGGLIGLTLGWPLTRLSLGINQVPMCEFFYYVSALSFVVSLLITLGVAAVINSFVGMRNKTVKMVESLKSIE